MNRTRLFVPLGLALLALQATSSLAQEDPGASSALASPAPPSPSARTKAAELKQRIHSLHKELLSGGPKVREADREALSFYHRKAESLEKQLYSSKADLLSAEAEYEAALDSTLNERQPRRIEALARNASEKKAALDQLHNDRKRLEQQRDLAITTATTIQKRVDRRQRLKDQFSDTDLRDTGALFSLPLAADEEQAPPPVNPFNRRILLDLARRDPIKARSIIRTQDPELYWQLWPLVPPQKILKRALPFPVRGRIERRRR